MSTCIFLPSHVVTCYTLVILKEDLVFNLSKLNPWSGSWQEGGRGLLNSWLFCNVQAAIPKQSRIHQGRSLCLQCALCRCELDIPWEGLFPSIPSGSSWSAGAGVALGHLHIEIPGSALSVV